MAQLYYSPISINAAQVPSTQTDFPVLVSVTDARFKDVAHSGHVNRSDGFDIRPYTDTTLGTAITGYELERYVPTTGELIMWVKVASLSSSTTPIVLGYGDTSITTDGSSASGCFSNSFLSIYHLKDGTTLSVVDALAAHNGTNHSGTAAAGQIDGCVSLASASSQYVDLGTITFTAAITLTAWINGTTFPGTLNSVFLRNNANATYFGMLARSDGKMGWYMNNAGVTQDPGSHTLSTGTWYHVAMAYDSTNGLACYVNAASDATHAANGPIVTTPSQSDIGRDNVNAGRFFNGKIDEVRIATATRSANWITTEYNNQNAPGTFETLGAESAVGTASTGNMFLLFP